MSRFGTQILTILSIAAAATLAACSKTADVQETPAVSAPANTAMAETPAPPQSANVRSFKIGELPATALLDGGIEVANDNKTLAVGKKPEDVAALLSAAGQPTDKLQLSIQPLLVKTADRVLLFDTGAAGAFGPTTGKLTTSLAEAGIDPGSVTDIFISHVHGDHVAGVLEADGTLAFPNATIHISKAEWEFLTKVEVGMAKNMGIGARDAMVATMKPKVDAFAPGAELVPGVVTAVDIKGHTPGHSGYKITSGMDSLLYIGDSMHHYIVSVQKPDWTIAFDHDARTAQASRAQLIADSAASGQRIYAVHFPFPGIGKFEKQGGGYVWVAE